MARNWNVNKGSCLVPEGTLVDVIHRDGEVFKREQALKDAHCLNWSIDENCKSVGDIIFWRLSKPKKEKAA